MTCSNRRCSALFGQREKPVFSSMDFPVPSTTLRRGMKFTGARPRCPRCFTECPYEVLEQRIWGRQTSPGGVMTILRASECAETFKAETPGRWNCFSKDLCVEIDASRSRKAVYAQFKDSLAEFWTPPPRTSRCSKCSSTLPFEEITGAQGRAKVGVPSAQPRLSERVRRVLIDCSHVFSRLK